VNLAAKNGQTRQALPFALNASLYSCACGLRPNLAVTDPIDILQVAFGYDVKMLL
jgi:hypothetical protein